MTGPLRLPRAVVLASVWLFACGGPVDEFAGAFKLPPTVQIGGHTLSLTAGLHEAGSRRSLALLATVRDPSGRGPKSPWSLAVSSPGGEHLADVVYDDSTEGSFMAWWWPHDPEDGLYTLDAQANEGDASVRFRIRDWEGVAPPSPSFEPASATVSWPGDDGTLSWHCEARRDGVRQLVSGPDDSRSCDLSPLEDGAYEVLVSAFSADLRALAQDRLATPTLPDAFFASETRLGVVKGGDAGGHQLRVAGGPLSYGPIQPGFALWVSLATGTAQPPAETWSVVLTGPNITGNALSLDYPAGARQVLVWSYDVRAREGEYRVFASNGGMTVSASFQLGDSAGLLVPAAPCVSPSESGGADVSWPAVPDARAYRVSAFRPGEASPAAARWTTGTSLKFEPGTFAAGVSYDVYLAAADVDPTSSPASFPAAVRVSESAYTPATFTAP